jgi:hypothetical protein
VGGDNLGRLELPCTSGRTCISAWALSCACGVQMKTRPSWFGLNSGSNSLCIKQIIVTAATLTLGTSGLTGQRPRISVLPSRTSVRFHHVRTLTCVPGPLPDAPGHSAGSVLSCACERGRAMHSSSVVGLRSPCEAGRWPFLPLR